MFLYALEFDMDRLFACLEDMEGFLDSNITHTPTLHIDPFRPHFILIFNPYRAFILTLFTCNLLVVFYYIYNVHTYKGPMVILYLDHICLGL